MSFLHQKGMSLFDGFNDKSWGYDYSCMDDQCIIYDNKSGREIIIDLTCSYNYYKIGFNNNICVVVLGGVLHKLLIGKDAVKYNDIDICETNNIGGEEVEFFFVKKDSNSADLYDSNCQCIDTNIYFNSIERFKRCDFNCFIYQYLDKNEWNILTAIGKLYDKNFKRLGELNGNLVEGTTIYLLELSSYKAYVLFDTVNCKLIEFHFDEMNLCEVTELVHWDDLCGSKSFCVLYWKEVEKEDIVCCNLHEQIFETPYLSSLTTKSGGIDCVKKFDNILFVENDNKFYIFTKEDGFVEITLKRICNVDNVDDIYVLENKDGKYNLFSAKRAKLLTNEKNQWLDGIYDLAEGVFYGIAEKNGKFAFVEVDGLGFIPYTSIDSRNDVNSAYWFDDCLEVVGVFDENAIEYVNEIGAKYDLSETNYFFVVEDNGEEKYLDHFGRELKVINQTN